MNHALTLHSDGTLTITLPKDAEVSRVVVNGVEYNLQRTCNKLATDCISRRAVIDALKTDCSWDIFDEYGNVTEIGKDIIEAIGRVPSAEVERDIPIKPIETHDKAWGIPKRQAVCPKCDYYLGHIAFLDCYKGKRITYCETCGQAIDWEGWEWDEHAL